MTDVMTDAAQALDLIARGTEEIIKVEDLQKKLATGKPLQIKVALTRPRPTCTLATPSLSIKCASFRILAMR